MNCAAAAATYLFARTTVEAVDWALPIPALDSFDTSAECIEMFTRAHVINNILVDSGFSGGINEYNAARTTKFEDCSDAECAERAFRALTALLPEIARRELIQEFEVYSHEAATAARQDT